MAHDVFISYSTRDQDISEAACAALEQTGIRCWMAPRDVLPGTAWAEAILDAITAARVMLLIFSGHSNASQQVLREVECALGEGLPILPVRIEDIPPSRAMRYFLGVPHRFDALTRPIEQHLPKLATKVQALLNHTASRRGARNFSESNRPSASPSPPGAECDVLDNLGLRIISEKQLPGRLDAQATAAHPGPMKLVAGATVGIDLGTTYSAIARLTAEGTCDVIENADGWPITPSVVLLGDDSNVIVGPSAERLSVEEPTRVVEAIKREMGNSGFKVHYQGHALTPEVISGLILKKLRQDAESRIGLVGNAVITVPHYFNDVRRKATQDAGRIAGLNVIDIINEPTAATLAYAWLRRELGRKDLPGAARTILVYDLGGGTFDVSATRYSPTSLRVLATDGDVMLGGLDWTRRLAEHVAAQFHRKFSLDPLDDPEARLTLMQVCEDAKRELSRKQQAVVHAYFRGKSLTVAVTRGDFDRMTGDLLQRTRDTVEFVLSHARIDIRQLDEVVLVGGATYMPMVERMLIELTGRAPSRELEPEKAVAQGAALHAAILEARCTGDGSRLAAAVERRLRSVQLQDVNSHSLGVAIRDPVADGRRVNHVMIPRNSPIPCSVTQRFETTISGQRRIHVRILEGESNNPDACTMIGDFRVTGLPPDLPAGSPVEVAYAYSSDGRIRATARDLTGGRQATAEIVRGSGLNEASLDVAERLIENYAIS